MKITGEGIRKGSSIYFYTPSENARENLFYPIAAGSFFCDKNYRVDRVSYDSFLAILVLDGEMLLEQKEIYIASKNELFLIDCYEPHVYYATKNTTTLWIHFDGQGSRQWYSNIVKQKGIKMNCSFNLSTYLLNIINCDDSNSNEYDFSRNIYSFLCELSKPENSSMENEKFLQMNSAKDYIKDNLEKDLSVEDIAVSVNLSASYFSKLFKETFSFSPYDYLLNVRLEKAKELLKSTSLPISEVAYKTGFKSDANFIYFFKKETGLSPLKFRNMKF